MYNKKEQNIKMFKKIISNYCGLELDRQRDSLVIERIINKIDSKHKNNIESYLLDLVQNDNKKLFEILNELTINETYFFRHIKQFELLRQYIINLLNKTNNKKIYIWSAACATGCEPYSIAILLEELKRLFNFDYHIFATDIDDNVLKIAKTGVYSKRAVTAEMPQKHLELYFDKIDNNKFKIKSFLQQNINFSKHNLLQDIYPSGIDVIFCRNVLIYFSKQNIEKIIKIFSKSLLKNGLLFLSPSETVHSNKNYFEEYRLPETNVKALQKWSTDRRAGEPKPAKQIMDLRKPLNKHPLPVVELKRINNKDIVYIKGVIKGKKRIEKIEKDFYKVCGKLSLQELPVGYELNADELKWLSNTALKTIIDLIEHAKNEQLFMVEFKSQNPDIKQWSNKAGISRHIKFFVKNQSKSDIKPVKSDFKSEHNPRKNKKLYNNRVKYKPGFQNEKLKSDRKIEIVKISNITNASEYSKIKYKLEETIKQIEHTKRLVLDFKNCEIITDKKYFVIFQRFCKNIDDKCEIIAKCYHNFGIKKMFQQFDLDKQVELKY